MISVKKIYETIPSGLTTLGAENKKKQLMRERNAHESASGYYAHESVKEALNVQYGASRLSRDREVVIPA